MKWKPTSILVGLAIGLFGACLLSELMWQRSLAANTTRRTPWSRFARYAVRLSFSVPRGIHEAVWGLLLINALGRDPLVAVLAIAIPFGAITAKVYAEFIDEAARGPFLVLRAAGARRTQATLFGVVPAIAHDLVSYGFYRLECSVRSAVILGMIGAGGLGFQLGLSFQGLQYGEMWTAIYAIVLLAVISETWAARLRRGAHQPSSSHVRTSVAVAAMVCCASWWYLGLRPWTLWSARTRMLTHRLISDMLPPRLAVRDVRPLLSAARETLQMSLLAVLIATAVAVPLAFSGTRINSGSRTSAVSRMVARLLRSIPPTVWALLVLFVMRPGVMSGAVALGVYASGVLARLFADALETAPRAPRGHLLAAGGRKASVDLYATLPGMAPTWLSLSLYRWEVAAREVVVVGVVGAGGLGRLLSAQTNAFAFRTLTTTLAAIIGVTVMVDLLSASVRRSLR